jgi:SAM-dependent methyltransferase
MKYRPTPPFLLLRRVAISIDKNGFFGSIVDAYRRIIKSLGEHGFGGTVMRVSRRPPKTAEEAAVMQPHPFDLLHGTDTGGYILGANLSAVSLSGLYITAYGSILPSVLTQALSELPIQYEDFTFVDVGCGKGRALLVAADFPFRHLLGIEIAGELCDIARANVATSPDWTTRISIVNQDAATVTLPDGPLLLFLYNPFFAAVLRRFLRNLERQLRRSPRPTYLLYARNPRFTKVLDSFPFLRELSDTGYALSGGTDTGGPFRRSEERFTLYSADFTR